MTDRNRERSDLIRRWRNVNRQPYDWRGLFEAVFALPLWLGLLCAFFFLPAIGLLRIGGVWPVSWGWIVAICVIAPIIIGLVMMALSSINLPGLRRFATGAGRMTLCTASVAAYVGVMTLIFPNEPIRFGHLILMALGMVILWFVEGYIRLRREESVRVRRRSG